MSGTAHAASYRLPNTKVIGAEPNAADDFISGKGAVWSFLDQDIQAKCGINNMGQVGKKENQNQCYGRENMQEERTVKQIQAFGNLHYHTFILKIEPDKADTLLNQVNGVTILNNRRSSVK